MSRRRGGVFSAALGLEQLLLLVVVTVESRRAAIVIIVHGLCDGRVAADPHVLGT